jgi:hypothetical protein
LDFHFDSSYIYKYIISAELNVKSSITHSGIAIADVPRHTLISLTIYSIIIYEIHLF